MWIATWGKGLNVVELKDLPHLSFVQITTDNTPQLKNDFVGSLCYDEMNNGIWIGTKEGLYFMIYLITNWTKFL